MGIFIAQNVKHQNDIDSNKKVAVISESIYKQVFEKDEEAIGELIQINGMNFMVIGLFEDSNMNMGPRTEIHIDSGQNLKCKNPDETLF